MPQVPCPSCDETVRYISRDTLPEIFRKHLKESGEHTPRQEHGDLDTAVRETLKDIDL